MAWQCPECGSLNNNSIIICSCGYEKGTITASPLPRAPQTANIEERLANKMAIELPHKGRAKITDKGDSLEIIIPHFIGKEIITLSPQALKIEKKEYLLSDIKNFKVYNIVENSIFSQRKRISFWFDYGKKSISFASGIDETDANYILELFKQRGIQRIEIRQPIKKYKGGTPIEKFFSYLGFFVLLLGFALFSKFSAIIENNFGGWGIMVIPIIWWAYFLIIQILLGRPCPSCKQWRAGEKQMTEGSQIFLKCKYCGHEWIIEKVDHPTGGG